MSKRNNIKITLDAKNVIILNNDFISISSTQIRNSVEKYKKYLNEKVYNYIKINNLYSFNDKFDIKQ